MTVLSRFSPGLMSSERQVSQLKSMRAGLDDLTRQLATGRRAETHGGYGVGRSAVLDMRAELARAGAVRQVADRAGVRLGLVNETLSALGRLASDARAEALTQPVPASHATAATLASSARARLNEAFSQLNTAFDGQYLFSGRATDARTVPDPRAVLDGTGTADGLRTLIAERRAADLGSGLGRLSLAQSGASVSIAEENPPPPFGFKLRSLVSSLSGGTVSGPDGIPRAATLTLSPLLSAGQTVTLELSLPDGSSESITLVARQMGSPPGEGAFTIAADPAITAANLRAALASAIAGRASTALSAASSVVAAEDYFAGTAENPARRIAGPPFETATGFAASGSRPTALWYGGEDAGGDARGTQVVALERGVSVGIGARAIEAPIRRVLAGLGAQAAETADPNDPNALVRSKALAERAAGLLAQSGGQGVGNIVADFAMAEASLGRARERQEQRTAFLEGAISEIEHPSMEELSASILAMKTRLEASYEVTARIGQMSLANYLG